MRKAKEDNILTRVWVSTCIGGLVDGECVSMYVYAYTYMYSQRLLNKSKFDI